MSKTFINQYTIQDDDEFFFDTNIWLLINPPLKNDDKLTPIYSSFFQKVLTKRCQIYTDFVVLSEFVNVSLREHMREVGHQKFKVYRKSKHYEEFVKTVNSRLKIILKHVEVIEHDKSLFSPQILCTGLENKCDFNDILIGRFCSEEAVQFVTNDQDFFSDINMSIISANPRLLK